MSESETGPAKRLVSKPNAKNSRLRRIKGFDNLKQMHSSIDDQTPVAADPASWLRRLAYVDEAGRLGTARGLQVHACRVGG